MEKQKLKLLITPKPVRIGTPCRNKKCLDSDACLDTDVNFLVETKSFALFDLFTNTEKHYR